MLSSEIDKKDIKKVVGIGYGRGVMDFVDKKVIEIICYIRGIYFLNNNIRIILDVGG